MSFIFEIKGVKPEWGQELFYSAERHNLWRRNHGR